MAETTRHDNDIAAWCVHGGRLAQAAEAFPRAPRPWIDLSTGINPRGWDAARAGEIDWRALPDETMLQTLEAAAAAHFAITADDVCAVPGSELGLRLLDTLGLPGPVRHVAPGYGTHAAVGRDGAIMAEELLAEADQGGTILLANPNNPDGRIWPAAMLVDAAARLSAQGGLLIVDEAFADVDPAIGLLAALPAQYRENVLVLRSFGKFFGLAGLRLGFVCGAGAQLQRLRGRLGNWPVSAAAMSIGTAAYRDVEWIKHARSVLRAETARLDALLLNHDLDPRGSCPLFRLVETPRARALFGQLARRGILTRPFQYAANWLRLGLPGDELAWTRLEEALRHG